MEHPRQFVGRQPEIKLVTPSKPNPWYGSFEEGKPFTHQQVAAMITAGITPVGCEAIEVKRNATNGEYWWPLRSPPPYFAFQCPVIGRMADGRIKIISPSGLPQIVRSDGWVGAPGKPRKDY
ncbi:hypothetical protein [Sphingomonas sp. CARO-RG-8B-R24-01]|uniref:hypothetical protein n=1 Tax=Sphingomonas sp. CARO-RG-8B-R24-01 TaxID=2914831 RepID=UPI001F5ACBB1|nr:hypothetical protein [Sphingomonas sp. CARO-RG-8B-R24-01]